MARPIMLMPTLRRAARLALTLGLLTAIVGCSDDTGLPAPEAAERYPPIAAVLSDALGQEITPMTSDDNTLQVSTDSSGCRLTGTSYLSEDLLTRDGPGAPDIGRITEVADEVLADHGFDALAPESKEPQPMEILLATDEQGGAMRVVVEARSGRPTLRLWWSAQLDTGGVQCDQALLS